MLQNVNKRKLDSMEIGFNSNPKPPKFMKPGFNNVYEKPLLINNVFQSRGSQHSKDITKTYELQDLEFFETNKYISPGDIVFAIDAEIMRQSANRLILMNSFLLNHFLEYCHKQIGTILRSLDIIDDDWTTQKKKESKEFLYNISKFYNKNGEKIDYSDYGLEFDEESENVKHENYAQYSEFLDFCNIETAMKKIKYIGVVKSGESVVRQSQNKNIFSGFNSKDISKNNVSEKRTEKVSVQMSGDIEVIDPGMVGSLYEHNNVFMIMDKKDYKSPIRVKFEGIKDVNYVPNFHMYDEIDGSTICVSEGVTRIGKIKQMFALSNIDLIDHFKKVDMNEMTLSDKYYSYKNNSRYIFTI